MAVQFNLLPDVKLAYLKAKRQQHIVTFLAISISIVAVSVFLILLSVVYGVQTRNLNNLNIAIKAKSSTLKSTDGLNEILTIQNQLSTLPSLYSSRPVATRLFEFLSSITPTDVTLTSVATDYGADTLNINGVATNVVAAQTYVDELGFVTYTTPSQPKAQPAFTKVTLGGFSAGSQSNSTSSFNVSLNFDPTLFSPAQQAVTMTVPNQTVTRSILDQPTLFNSNSGGQ